MRFSSRPSPFRSWILSTLTLLLFAPLTHAQEIQPEQLYEWVKGISGKDQAGRREFVRSELQRLGASFEEISFDTSFEARGSMRSIAGANIIAKIGTGDRSIVVGAHYDAVPGSPGANDDGGGVAILLGLLSSLRQEEMPTTIRFCFFDQEEQGLIGSAVYVRDHAPREGHLAMINLDVVGMGSELYVGPVGDGDDDYILPQLRLSATELGLTLLEEELYPSSDHLSFARAGLENIALSIVPEGDTRKVTRMLRGEKMTKEQIPIVLQTMHTPNDGPETVEPAALHTVYTLVRELLVRIGRNAGE
jgi:Zn-dependent M28 family amino/carboxypeptidase